MEKNLFKNNGSVIFENAFLNFDTGELLSPIETPNYFIVQVTESQYATAFVIDEHTQFCDLEITLAQSNGLFCDTDGRRDKLEKLDSYLSFRNDKHYLSSKRGCRFQTLAINFKDEKNKTLLRNLQQKFKNNRISKVDISAYLSEIISEFLVENAPFSRDNLDSLITLLLIRIIRENYLPPNTKKLLGVDTLPSIINYIDRNFCEINSLSDLSAFGYSYCHICKIFKKTYGFTPNEYLISKKMEHSLSLFSQNMTIAEVSEILHYSSPYNFSRAFKKFYGSSPKNYFANKRRI